MTYDKIKVLLSVDSLLGRSKIDLIRAYRSGLGVKTSDYPVQYNYPGLYDSKVAVERMMDGESLPYEITEYQYVSLIRDGFLVERLDSGYFKRHKGVTVYDPLVHRKKIDVIKRIRACLGLGLKEAKDMSDHMDRVGGPIPAGNITEYQVHLLRENGFQVMGFIDDSFKDSDDLFKI